MRKIIYVADLFSEDYSGGAEKTTESLYPRDKSGISFSKKRCTEISEDYIMENKDAEWYIFNFSGLSDKNKISLCKNTKFSIIEYDYKFCKYRSIRMHELRGEGECDCSDQESSKINLVFYGMAKKVWFMSEQQRQIFLEKVKTIKLEKTEVLSSVFHPGDLRFIDSLKGNEKDETYLIVKTSSWVKGYDQCLLYAKDKGLDYEVVENVPYHELLIKLSTSKGLIFLPVSHDTCPRLVLEAQMLGCDVITNEFVQHTTEDWSTSQESCYEYMKTRQHHFWQSENML